MEASETPRPPASIVRMGLFFYGAMGIAALVWRMWTPGDSILHPSPAAAARAWSVPAALGAGLAAGLVALAISEALTRWTALGQALSDLLAESLGPLDRANAWLLALASGLAEEMFFRGALQPKVGILGASILFGAAHFLPRRELALWSVYAIGIGLGLGALYEWTGQLVAPVAAHVLVNGINLPRLAGRAKRPGSVAERDGVDLDPRA
jgi:membrane protease YdiL (CAAX protease family)